MKFKKEDLVQIKIPVGRVIDHQVTADDAILYQVSFSIHADPLFESYRYAPVWVIENELELVAASIPAPTPSPKNTEPNLQSIIALRKAKAYWI